ncbi:MAG: hypothetical protein GF311_25160 [Candidatus Lokiarchaeota archaeon]|nr:hypothetical protein [Candidatus Lokiarchaeota archaeon]
MSFNNSNMKNLDEIFLKIKHMLEKHSNDFYTAERYIDSKAKDKKPAYHVYGNKEVSLFGKDPQKTYIAGIIQQKNYVSFYFNPIYSHPDEFRNISPALNKFLKGKSCFNINNLSPSLLEEIESLLLKGIEKYKDIEWI